MRVSLCPGINNRTREKQKLAEINMAAFKSFISLSPAVVLLLLVALGTKTETAEAQNGCSNQLTNLNVCAAFVVPGAPNTRPSSDCCSALQSVDRDCLCSTIRIASQLPSQCQIPSITCDN